GKANDLCACFFEKFSAMISHITQSLHYNSFPFNSRGHAEPVHYLFHTAYFANAKENTETCCFPSSSYPALHHRLSCNASQCVNFSGLHAAVCVEYPGHFSFTCSIIRCGNVDAGADK